MQIFLLPFNVNVIDNVSACTLDVTILGFTFREFFTPISIPPPFCLNFFGFTGSGGAMIYFDQV